MPAKILLSPKELQEKMEGGHEQFCKIRRFGSLRNKPDFGIEICLKCKLPPEKYFGA